MHARFVAMMWAVPPAGVPEPRPKAPAVVPRAEPPTQPRTAIRAQERSCCCSAPPRFRVVVPAGADRARPTDLLLCGHHYRASKDALERLHVAVFDQDGALIAG